MARLERRQRKRRREEAEEAEEVRVTEGFLSGSRRLQETIGTVSMAQAMTEVSLGVEREGPPASGGMHFQCQH